MANDTPKCLVKIQNLNVTMNNKVILQDINLDIFYKQIITLIGPNGAGKSTLIKTILGFVKPSSGKIITDSQLIIGYLPQTISFPEQIPISVMTFLSLNQHKNLYYSSLFTQLKQELSIEHLLAKSMHDLSGGELQKILLTKALLNKPNLLILDEPTKSIDVNGQAKFYKLCLNIQEKFNCALLMASHDLHIVMSGNNFVICLNKHICCHGLANNVSKDQEFIKLFGKSINKLAFYSHHHDHQHDIFC